LVAALPLTFFFFHDPERSERQEASAQSALNNRRNYLKAMMSRSFVGLVLAGALFACAYYGLMVHFVPILTNSGIGLSAAAGIVALVGLASIVGRLLSGLLLDTLPTRAVAITAFLLPLVTVALLNGLPGSVPGAIAAVLALGLASGAELNTITYVAARRFGQEVFGSIYAMFMAIIALGASIGPLMAGILFDARGSYHLYLLVLAPIFLAAAVLIAWVPLVSPEDESAI
jgi:predicted MFS family arabinose efflux permease